MPIRPEMRARYPADWKAISKCIRFHRAGGRCECPGGREGCGLHRGRRCVERHGEAAKWANGKVILTCAHLNHEPSDCRDANLRACCQRCHLLYDKAHHAETAALTRDARSSQGRLFDVRPAWPVPPAHEPTREEWAAEKHGQKQVTLWEAAT